MQCTCSNKLIVTNPTDEIMTWCRNTLYVDNPDYWKKQRMGKYTGRTPKEIKLYEVNDNVVCLPFGCLYSVYYHFKDNMEFTMDIKPFYRQDYKSHINLYPYQEEAVKRALSVKNGVIVMPCGAGKTQTALEIIARVGGKALWLTHTYDLLHQSMNRAKSVLDAPLSSYGMISNGRVNIGSGITFATVQTMAKIDLTQYKDTWDIVVVDEVHKAVGCPTKIMQFYKVLSALSCRYKIGVTATPKRADGLEKTMFALLGGIIHEVPKEAVAGNTCPVKVKFVPTDYTPDPDNITMGDGTLDYASLITDLTHDPERFEVVSEYIQGLGSSVLVLGNRVEYLQALCDDYMGKSMCLSGMGNSKTAKRMRAKALEDLNNGDIDCLFATYQLAKEGLDCPNLRYVVFATPEKDPTTVTQSAGRVGRKADNKPFGTVIDFVDAFGMYRGWQKKRMAVYKKLDFEII